MDTCTPVQTALAAEMRTIVTAEPSAPRAGWVLQRTEDGRWQASDGFHATTPAATREEAIEAGRAAVALWAGEVGP